MCACSQCVQAAPPLRAVHSEPSSDVCVNKVRDPSSKSYLTVNKAIDWRGSGSQSPRTAVVTKPFLCIPLCAQRLSLIHRSDLPGGQSRVCMPWVARAYILTTRATACRDARAKRSRGCHMKVYDEVSSVSERWVTLAARCARCKARLWRGLGALGTLPIRPPDGLGKVGRKARRFQGRQNSSIHATAQPHR